MKLSKPCDHYRESYLAMRREFLEGPGPVHPMALRSDCDDWGAYLARIRDAELGHNLAPGMVPALNFWLIDKYEEVVGAAQLRTRLTPRLIQSGGHIGYGVRPSQRRKGYATELLRLTLLEALKLGIRDVMVSCSPDNEASRRVILANGGHYDSTSSVDGAEYQRYWIFL